MPTPLPTSSPFPSTAEVLSRATRLTTPCGPYGDGRVVWHVWGRQDSALPPVVLFHGGSGSWTHWVRNVGALADSGRWVLAVDLPGFGDSAVPPTGGDADAMPEPLEVGLSGLLGERQCDLVGFSFGGLTAGLFALQYPERLHRLVIVGAPGLGLATRRNQGLKAWRHLTDAAEQREIHRYNLGALMLHHPESIDEQAVEIQQANVPRDRLPDRRLAFLPTLLDALPQLSCPVDAIYGFEDALYQGRQAQLEAAIRNATPALRDFQFIADAGHWVQYERAAAFNAALIAVLNQS